MNSTTTAPDPVDVPRRLLDASSDATRSVLWDVMVAVFPMLTEDQVRKFIDRIATARHNDAHMHPDDLEGKMSLETWQYRLVLQREVGRLAEQYLEHAKDPELRKALQWPPGF